MKLKILSLKPSTRKDKKWVATFSDGTVTHFGQNGYEDYTIHKNPEKRIRYIQRHLGEDWSDARKAGTLSRYLLWEYPTLLEAIRSYIKRFNL